MTSISSGQFEPYVPQLLLDWPESIRYRQIEGSLVHVDISGFTAMSERLARKGRIGAEEVSSVLNNTFTELLAVADQDGGDLLKFGGDALLLLFTGNGHALRAVRASAMMRSRLRSIGKVQTPAGRVELRMTVGVHSGLFDAFLVGETHRELLVIGPGASKTVAVEEAAEAGQILLSPETAAQLPGNLLGDTRGLGVLLQRTPSPIDYTPSIIFCQEECRDFIPSALRAVVTAPGDGEHRRVTVAFLKFAGTDGMLDRWGATTTADRLEELVSVVQRAAEHYNVTFLSTDIDADGGKIIITGGVPVATGSDEERVLRAVRKIVDECDGMSLKVGVNHGPAFAGDVGAPFRRTYTVIGDAINLAARVMSKAQPGEILATTGVLDRSATLFAVSELPPFAVKGKTEPVRAWKIGPITGRRTVAESESPLFGRDRNLETAEEYLSGQRSAGLIGISGTSGIGKSRFVRELRFRNPNHTWRFSDCDQYESSTPFYVFRRLLREVADIDRDAPPEQAAAEIQKSLEVLDPELLAWFPLLASVMDLPAAETTESAQLDPAFRQARLYQVVGRFIDSMCGESSSLVIEDAQWLDEESRGLLRFLAGHASGRDWGLIVVHRPFDEPLEADDLVEIELEPLDDEASRLLIEHTLRDTPLLDHELDDIVTRGGGNPLFLVELAAAARTGEVLPDNVESLVQARIDRLDREKRKLLRHSSVAGMTFDPAVLAEALRDDLPGIDAEDAWAGLDEFLVRRSSGEFRFRQSLFHDVAYSGISFRVRRRLHQRIGNVLETRSDDPDELAEVLSLHFLLAGEHGKAWEYSRAAGLQACSKHANVAATRFYQRALESARTVEIEPIELARVAEALGNVAELAGMHEEAERGLRRAAALRKGDAGGLARIYRKVGLLRERSGKYPQALRWFTRGLRHVAEPRSEREALQQIELQLAYAGVRFRQARYDECIEWAEKSVVEAERLAQSQATAHGYYLVALAGMRSGRAPQQGNTERALAIYEELGDLIGQSNVLNKLGVDAYHAGDWTLARDYYRRSKEARQKAGDSVRAAMITQNEALVLSDQGRLDEAEQLFIHALREFQAAEDQMATGVATSNLGRILTRRRRFADGLELLERACSDLEEIGAGQFVLDAKARIAENLVLSGNVDQGERMVAELSAGLKSDSDDRHCLLNRIRSYVALERGDHDTARRILEKGVELARTAGNRYELALQLDALAQLTNEQTIRADADQILDSLGIESVPRLPGR